jgi:hypothetical protein
MHIREFNAVAQRTETDDEVQFDVRPFGDKQGEAIDLYLHDRVAALQYQVGGFGPRLVVIIHDSRAKIPKSALGWLDRLNSAGVPTEIRRVQ